MFNKRRKANLMQIKDLSRRSGYIEAKIKPKGWRGDEHHDTPYDKGSMSATG